MEDESFEMELRDEQKYSRERECMEELQEEQTLAKKPKEVNKQSWKQTDLNCIRV